MLFEGRINEGIREIDAISDNKDLRIACNLALIHANKMQDKVDTRATSTLGTAVREERKGASEISLYFAGLFLLFVSKLDKATEYSDKLLTKSPNYKLGKILRGWIDLFKGSIGSASSHFTEAAKSNEIEGVLGKSMTYFRQGAISKASNLLGNLISTHSQFIPAFMEKLKASLAAKEWDQVIDLSGKLHYLDRHSIDAHRYWILYSIVWNRQEDEQIVARMSDLAASFELREPKNAPLYMETAKIFSRICEHNLDVIRKTIALVDRASFVDSKYQVEACVELGHQNLLIGRLKDARRQFQSAASVDQRNLNAQVGLLLCSFKEDPTGPETLETLETLEELHKSQMTPELAYLSVLTGESRGKSSQSVLQTLNSMTNAHLDKLGKVISLSFYKNLNPDLILDLVRLYLQFVPSDPQPVSSSNALNECLSQAIKLLEPLLNSCPVHREPFLLSAEIKFLSGNPASALSILDKYNDLFASGEDEDARCHLLKGRILCHSGQIKAAQAALDAALAADFKVKNNPIYVLIQSSILKYYKKYEDAINCVKPALEKLERSRSVNLTTKQIEHKINIHLLLASLHDLLDESSESEKILNQLHDEFSGTSHEAVILMAKAASAEAKGSLDQALMILRSTGSDHPNFFILSRQKMAKIYLDYRKERRLMISCYREILDREESKAAYLMMGDAYMTILEPEKAVETYELCLKKNPRDSTLIRKVGQALVRAHFYDKAITYYKAAVKTASSHVSSQETEDESLEFALKYDLAELLFKMKRYSESRELIKSALSKISDQDTKTLQVLEWEAKLMYLLASNESKTRDEKELLITSLKNAYTLQAKVFKRTQIENQDSTDVHRRVLIKIGCELAELLNDYSRNTPAAVSVYKELLNLDHRNVKVISSLARLEIQMNEFESAQNHLSLLIKYASKDDHESILTMTEMLIGRNDLEAALNQLTQLLEQNPSHLTALAKFVEVARRVGKLTQVSKFLDRAALYSEKDPKYHFCRGLYEWYVQDTGSAIRSFFKCKNDRELGQLALLNMVEIYLNPECEVIGGSALNNQNFPSSLDNERNHQVESNIKTASKLLDEILNKYGDSFEHRTLRLSILLVRKNKRSYEQALSGFSEFLKESPDYVPAMVGMATGHMLNNQVSKAKVTLKKILKMDFVEATQIEKAALLLADAYIQSGKLEPAKSHIERVLKVNKSSIRAYEMTGAILERETHHLQAAASYAIGYELCNHRSPSLGYKLALNLFKGGKFTAAVDVVRDVLTQFPEYPILEKELINKALQAIQNNKL